MRVVQWQHFHIRAGGFLLFVLLRTVLLRTVLLRTVGGQPWVKWTYQPIERGVVDQVVHDSVQGVFHFPEL